MTDQSVIVSPANQCLFFLSRVLGHNKRTGQEGGSEGGRQE